MLLKTLILPLKSIFKPWPPLWLSSDKKVTVAYCEVHYFKYVIFCHCNIHDTWYKTGLLRRLGFDI